MIILTGLFRAIIDRKDAAVQFIVVAIILLRHFFAVEPFLGVCCVRMFRLSPVQLPSGVGPQFIEARIERILQGKRTPALAVCHLYQLPFNEIAVLIQQIGIEHSAYVAWYSEVCAPRVCLKPYCVAKEIAGVVRVDIHLFLRYRFAEAGQSVGPLANCSRNILCRCC